MILKRKEKDKNQNHCEEKKIGTFCGHVYFSAKKERKIKKS